MISKLRILIGAVLVNIQFANGGTCFGHRNERGSCKHLSYDRVSRDQCCGQKGFYVDRDLSPSELIRLSFSNRGINPCHPACVAGGCQSVDCGQDKTCIDYPVVGPVCTCHVTCSHEESTRGPVCASNGERYLNGCEMKREKCKLNIRFLREITCPQELHCQPSTCPEDKACVINSATGKVECQLRRIMRCPFPDEVVCGRDNVTYANMCARELAGQYIGRTVEVAYVGACRASATCASVTCPQGDNMACISNNESRTPVCINCRPQRVCYWFGQTYNLPPVCGSNRRTYENVCYLNRSSCSKGHFIEFIQPGSCQDLNKL